MSDDPDCHAETTVLAYFWRLPTQTPAQMLDDIAGRVREGTLRLAGVLRHERPERILASLTDPA